jgi:acyl-CoA hydrolase
LNKGVLKSTWERAEALIAIADHQFQEELIREAEKMKIWRNGNKAT